MCLYGRVNVRVRVRIVEHRVAQTARAVGRPAGSRLPVYLSSSFAPRYHLPALHSERSEYTVLVAHGPCSRSRLVAAQFVTGHRQRWDRKGGCEEVAPGRDRARREEKRRDEREARREGSRKEREDHTHRPPSHARLSTRHLRVARADQRNCRVREKQREKKPRSR